MTRHRNSISGRFADPAEAAAAPDTHVSEALPEPVDLEAGAEAFYAAWVVDGGAWAELGQEYRDRLRHALREALQAL